MSLMQFQEKLLAHYHIVLMTTMFLKPLIALSSVTRNALFSDSLGDHFLELFNVKSGDLLSEIAMESRVYSLTACPRKRLIAIYLEHCKVNFKVLQVKLPRDEGRKRKR